jgi:hypothetical protein
MWRVVGGLFAGGLAYLAMLVDFRLGADVIIGSLLLLVLLQMRKQHEIVGDELDRIRTTQLISVYDGDNDETD